VPRRARGGEAIAPAPSPPSARRIPPRARLARQNLGEFGQSGPVAILPRDAGAGNVAGSRLVAPHHQPRPRRPWWRAAREFRQAPSGRRRWRTSLAERHRRGELQPPKFPALAGQRLLQSANPLWEAVTGTSTTDAVAGGRSSTEAAAAGTTGGTSPAGAFSRGTSSDRITAATRLLAAMRRLTCRPRAPLPRADQALTR
jgi:hypothetical protein